MHTSAFFTCDANQVHVQPTTFDQFDPAVDTLLRGDVQQGQLQNI
jgi:hypothetical protein